MASWVGETTHNSFISFLNKADGGGISTAHLKLKLCKIKKEKTSKSTILYGLNGKNLIIL
jgi:hypothetical protein